MPKPISTAEHKEKMIAKIRATLYLKKLDDHIVNGPNMDQSQVHAALKLIGKVIPDLKAVEHTGEQQNVTAIHLHL